MWASNKDNARMRKHFSFQGEIEAKPLALFLITQWQRHKAVLTCPHRALKTIPWIPKTMLYTDWLFPRFDANQLQTIQQWFSRLWWIGPFHSDIYMWTTITLEEDYGKHSSRLETLKPTPTDNPQWTQVCLEVVPSGALGDDVRKKGQVWLADRGWIAIMQEPHTEPHGEVRRVKKEKCEDNWRHESNKSWVRKKAKGWWQDILT